MRQRQSFAVKVTAAAVVVIALLVGSSSALAGATSPRAGALHLTKECSQYQGQAGQFCTITSSNVPGIKVGMRVVYASAAGADGVNSNIVVSDGNGNAAFGHVRLDFATLSGTVTLFGGTGDLRHFYAVARVTNSDGFNWAWDGIYVSI